MNTEGLSLTGLSTSVPGHSAESIADVDRPIRLPLEQIVAKDRSGEVVMRKGALDSVLPDEKESEKGNLSIQKNEDLAEGLNQILDAVGNSKRIRFSVSDGDHLLLQIVDLHTGEVVKSFPPEEVADMMDKIRDAIGLVIDELR